MRLFQLWCMPPAHFALRLRRRIELLASLRISRNFLLPTPMAAGLRAAICFFRESKTISVREPSLTAAISPRPMGRLARLEVVLDAGVRA